MAGYLETLMITTTSRKSPVKKPAAKSVSPVKAKPRAPAIGRAKRPFAIDVHAHMSDPMVGKFIRETAGRTGGGFVTTSGVSKAMIAAQKRHMDYVRERQRDVPLRLRELDAMGIDMQVISSSPAAGCYWAEGKTGLEMAAHNNDLIAETVAKYPDRFVGVGTVPMQDVTLAVKELRRCVRELDLRGVIIGSYIEGLELGDRKLWKFWKELEALDVPCYIHPDGFTHPQRLGKYYMWNTIAQPLEEALAMSSFIYEGVMDAFPKLKILVCHGGGYLPFYNGRADMGYIARPETRGRAAHKPSDYFKRFYYDTVFYDDRMLEFLVERVGDSQIMMGTDFPHFAQTWNGAEFISKAKRLSRQTKERILSKNAAKMFGIRL